MASASVDTSEDLVWDSGELERTSKSHKKAVSDCQFESIRKVLGECFVHYCRVVMWAKGFGYSDVFRRSVHKAVERP